MHARASSTAAIRAGILPLLLAALAACGDDATSPPPPITAPRLAIVGAPGDVFEGDVAALRAVRITGVSDTVAVEGATWAVDDASRAELGAGGVVTFLKPGGVTITVRAGAQSVSRTFGVKRLTVQQVTLLPAGLQLAKGEVAVLGVKVQGEGGRLVIGRAVTLASEHPAIAIIDAAGRVHAVAPGRATIRATADGVVGTAVVEVRDESAMLELSRVDGGRLPLLTDADTVEWDGVREYHEVFIERGTLVLTGGSTPRYAIDVKYVQYHVTCPVGQRSYRIRAVWNERDFGVVTRDARGDLVMTSEFISPLQHTAVPDNDGVQVRYRIPGDFSYLQLSFRKPL